LDFGSTGQAINTGKSKIKNQKSKILLPLRDSAGLAVMASPGFPQVVHAAWGRKMYVLNRYSVITNTLP
jgi:hypothetical protein